MEPLIFALAVAVAAIAGIVVMRVRLERARDAAVDAQRQLAVETERASRIPPLEQALREKTAQYDTLRDTLGKLEQSLATRTEAVDRLEAAEHELRQRLESAIQRVDGLLRENAGLESANAEKAALLTEKADASERLRVRLEQAETALGIAQETVAHRVADIAGLKADLEQERKAAEEKLRLLIEAREQMTQEFRLLANNVMQTHGETFSKQNKEQIDTILAPLREKLTEFQQGIQTAQVETTKERASLAEQIRLLTENSAKITSETNNLARALRGEAQTQGAWGEMILASILEKSGLRAGEEYIVQQSIEGEEGRRLRPDVVVNLPGGQKIVIDSKVSLVGFDRFVNAGDDADRAVAMGQHLTSMRTHIRTLSGKDYHSAAGSQIDYVIMFVPIEGALAAALTADPGITAFAVENNVAIATPTTLMIALRTVNNVWQVERRNQNAEAIARRAGYLYDKLVGFVGDMTAIETSLARAQKSYGDAMGKLSTGGGNLIRQAEQLKELGAKARRSLPAALTGDDRVDLLAEAEDAPAEG